MSFGELRIYNSLTRKKEIFEPLHAPHVGLYVCGPTVYSDVHLGNCRTFTMFDVVYRYLSFLGYKVRYVRNITDVGHLVGDADEGEDKIAKKAKLENLEPMEIVQRYTNGFHDVMKALNNISPSIEPTATGHIPEQISLVERIIENGYAYERNGSVYFDVEKYNQNYHYGKLSGRNIEEQLAGHRTLDAQEEKRQPVDFAIWKKANPEHIMRWHSPWGEGFPGWHLECSVMSMKYLGNEFDIHGGGLDLQFPHHECEIAQAVAGSGKDPVRYWMHSNMLTMNGTKMSKSLGNVIMPAELFEGTNALMSEAYSPMVLRFFMLQTHYRSTMDISDDALKAAKSGYLKLINALRTIRNMDYENTAEDIQINEKAVKDIQKSIDTIHKGLNDDFNTAVALSGIFNLVKKVNTLQLGQLLPAQLGKETFELLKHSLLRISEDVLGLQEETPNLSPLIDVVLDMYKQAKESKDYDKVDALRQEAKAIGIVFRDLKNGSIWAYEE
ncbi:MAG: cysteine--tRNA ligase [Bernardetiaceae bacterium]|nr:cysteine--tRNA ligase [Bernardetiaceae bacterium]